MKIMIEKNELERIAEDLTYNVAMLEYTDADSTEDDLSFYLPRIRDGINGLLKMISDGTTIC